MLSALLSGRGTVCRCALDFTVAVGGPLTTCAEDALLVYTVMAAEQPPDVPLLRLPISLLDRTSSLTGLKVGVYREVRVQGGLRVQCVL